MNKERESVYEELYKIVYGEEDWEQHRKDLRMRRWENWFATVVGYGFILVLLAFLILGLIWVGKQVL